MSRYVSQKNPVSASNLKRRALGTVVLRHYGREDVRFTRCVGGWRVEREENVWVWPPVIMSSSDVANECNRAIGCRQSWAKVY